MTGDQLILEALLLLGVRYPGQTISPEARTTSLLGLNMLLGEWNATGQAVYSVGRVTAALVNGQATLTAGPGGTFPTRPEKIEAWASTTAGGTSDDGKPVDALTFEALVDDAALTGSRIRALTYDAAYPVGTIRIYPIPNGGQTLSLWVWSQLAAVTDTALDLDFPPGYLKAILYNLAVDLAPKFGRKLDPTIKLVADQCKSALGASNASEHSAQAQQQ
jgi:hypothetical protein